MPRRHRILSRAVLGAAVATLAACGGTSGTGPTSPPPPPPPPPPVPVATVEVSPASATMLPAQTTQLTATTRDATGATVNGRTVTWSTGNAGVASVSTAGLVTAVSPGIATIAATSEGKTGTSDITVLAPVATVTVDPPAATVAPGQTVQLTAATLDGAGNPLSGRPVVWTSGSTGVASVSVTGLVTAVAAGSATITATSEGKSGSGTITVPAPVASVSVAPGASTLVVAQTAQLTATPRDAAGAALAGRSVSWASTDPGTASVSSAGLVTAVTPGAATVTATAEGKTGQSVITVLAPVASVVITGVLRVKVGDTYSYTATARTADGAEVTRSKTWGIVEVARGDMSADGSLTPLATGTITVRVTIDGIDWFGTLDAYDWRDLSTAGNLIQSLESDLTITNRFGTTERPDLNVACTPTGFFFVWVSTQNFVTANGLVAYSFDGGSALTQTWDELSPNFRTLWHPGPTNVERRAFGALLALSRRFGFAFSEFLGSARATVFRVTGLGPRLAPLVAACPSNSLAPDPVAAAEAFESVRLLVAGRTAPSASALERGRRGPAATAPPSLARAGPSVGSIQAVPTRR
ncbi:MAG: Ig domain-containing protein [Gemmatimonadales bacterium]